MKQLQAVPAPSRMTLVPDQLARKSRTAVSLVRRPDICHNYLVPVLAKALTIMNLLEQAEQPMNLQQVCDATNYAKTTVYRILRTLSAFGYIRKGITAFTPLLR